MSAEHACAIRCSEAYKFIEPFQVVLVYYWLFLWYCYGKIVSSTSRLVSYEYDVMVVCIIL